MIIGAGDMGGACRECGHAWASHAGDLGCDGGCGILCGCDLEVRPDGTVWDFCEDAAYAPGGDRGEEEAADTRPR